MSNKLFLVLSLFFILSVGCWAKAPTDIKYSGDYSIIFKNGLVKWMPLFELTKIDTLSGEITMYMLVDSRASKDQVIDLVRMQGLFAYNEGMYGPYVFWFFKGKVEKDKFTCFKNNLFQWTSDFGRLKCNLYKKVVEFYWLGDGEEELIDLENH